MNHAKCYKKGYPRPRFVRENYTCLNGEWEFAFDDANVGEAKRYFEKAELGGKIIVPYSYHTKSSGIFKDEPHDYLWYSQKFTYNLPEGKRLLLHFEGADYKTKVWLNGNMLGEHLGGYARFSFDVTDYLKKGENLLNVKCEDKATQLTARGKQRYVEKNVSCFYTPTSGIWKTVWLEEVSDSYLADVKISCEYENVTGLIEYRIGGYTEGLRFVTEITYMDEKVVYNETEVLSEYGKIRVDLTLRHKVLNIKPWSAGRCEQFYDVKYYLKKDGVVIDEVGSYTALVDYRVRSNWLQVNYLPTYLRMVLDQGYWTDGGMTATEEELQKDVELMKEMGFNGVRKHQKIEAEQFYYFCDMMGLYCWLEMPAMYDYTPEGAAQFTKEWVEVVNQYRGYVSLMAYVPVNESWGVLQTSENKQMQAFTAGLYYITKSLDPNRLVISNDGWEHTVSDIATVHNYASEGRDIELAYGNMQSFMDGNLTPDLHVRTAYADGWKYGGQPVIVSEYAGIAFEKDKDGWGYGAAVRDEEAFLARLRDLTQAIVNLDGCQGYCVTQLTDLMQEKNGLLTEDRTPKADVAKIKEINSLKHK